jgi:hypothetical protein
VGRRICATSLRDTAAGVHRSFVGSPRLRQGLRRLRMTGRDERNARQLPAQVGGVALAVLGVVQDGVHIAKNVPLADRGIVVAAAELFERPVRDVLAPIGTVFGVGVERETLGVADKVEVREYACLDA